MLLTRLSILILWHQPPLACLPQGIVQQTLFLMVAFQLQLLPCNFEIGITAVTAAVQV